MSDTHTGSGRGGYRPGGGRPAILTEHLIHEIESVLLAGSFVEVACDFVGISRDTFYEWVKRGAAEANRRAVGKPLERLKGKALAKELDRRKAEDLYFRFSDTVKKARARAEVGLLGLIQKHAQEHHQAAAWILERMAPERWGAKRKVLVEVDTAVREQLDRSLDKLEAAVAAGEIDAATYEKVLAVFADLEAGGDDVEGGGG